MDQPTCLIIGLGYLGRVVAQRWVAAGRQVWATTRSAARASDIAEQGITPIQWDVLSGGDSLPAADTVLYCVGYDRSQDATMRQVYVDGLSRTLAALPGSGKFIYTSSTGVYGDTGGAWISEGDPAKPIDESGAVCLEAEAATLAQPVRTVTVLRLAGLYGPGRMLGAAAVKAGEPVAAVPDTHLNLIHVQDAASAVIAAEERGTAGRIYNVSDGVPVTRRSFYAEVARLLDAPPPTFDPTAARRHRGDRKVSNLRMRAELRFDLQYPDYRSGLQDALTSTRV